MRVEANDARRRFFDALDPVRKLAELFMRTSGADPRTLRYVVRVHPLTVEVTLSPDEGRPAWSVHVFEARRLPDGGAALKVAVETVAAAILERLPAETAVTVAGSATLDGGGLFVLADPSDELAMLGLAVPGRSLGEGVVLGALADAPEVLH